mmetsp:Transcript_140953/g.449889  ORF Transcript_140953/g.449889 Transcript_140953/m.449889 type:complete len:484 (+) Transcript_140953:246-1697(+)
MRLRCPPDTASNTRASAGARLGEVQAYRPDCAASAYHRCHIDSLLAAANAGQQEATCGAARARGRRQWRRLLLRRQGCRRRGRRRRGHRRHCLQADEGSGRGASALPAAGWRLRRLHRGRGHRRSRGGRRGLGAGRLLLRERRLLTSGVEQVHGLHEVPAPLDSGITLLGHLLLLPEELLLLPLLLLSGSPLRRIDSLLLAYQVGLSSLLPQDLLLVRPAPQLLVHELEREVGLVQRQGLRLVRPPQRRAHDLVVELQPLLRGLEHLDDRLPELRRDLHALDRLLLMFFREASRSLDGCVHLNHFRGCPAHVLQGLRGQVHGLLDRRLIVVHDFPGGLPGGLRCLGGLVDGLDLGAQRADLLLDGLDLNATPQRHILGLLPHAAVLLDAIRDGIGQRQSWQQGKTNRIFLGGGLRFRLRSGGGAPAARGLLGDRLTLGRLALIRGVSFLLLRDLLHGSLEGEERAGGLLISVLLFLRRLLRLA